MKKIISILFTLLSVISVSAQVELPLDREGNTYYLNASIGNEEIRFVFDTGATSVLLPYGVFQKLRANKTIADADMLGNSSATTADGRSHQTYMFTIKDINLQGIHIKNVIGSTIIDQEGSALFGMSAIKKLGTHKLSNDKLILENLSAFEFDDSYKLSIFGLKFGKATYGECVNYLKPRFDEDIIYDDNINKVYRDITLSNGRLAGEDFSVAILLFIKNILVAAIVGYPDMGVQEAIKQRDRIFNLYSRKYKYSKTYTTEGIKEYDLGYTEACRDITIGIWTGYLTSIKHGKKRSVQIQYYPNLVEDYKRGKKEWYKQQELNDI